jgi:hypothetical protein
MYFCKQILQDLIYKDFLQCNNAQIWIWSYPLQRYTQLDSKEIYFVFFQVLFHFSWILES